MTHVRPDHVVRSALNASDAGVRDADNSAAHGVAVKTIRRWRRDYQRLGRPRGQAHTRVPCPRCDGGPLDDAAYAELLGWYLGDGHLARARRQVYRLAVIDDARYPDDIESIAALMRRVKPGSRPHRRSRPGAIVVAVDWKHWPCLFPQHGPGRKHTRPIQLEGWQERIVLEHPAAFLKGLFHSDGARVANWTVRTVGGQPKRYDYPRWQFVNASADILGLAAWALDLVEVPWRRSAERTISVSTRAGVRRLDHLIGLKT